MFTSFGNPPHKTTTHRRRNLTKPNSCTNLGKKKTRSSSSKIGGSKQRKQMRQTETEQYHV
jgi:hypothetical protein